MGPEATSASGAARSLPALCAMRIDLGGQVRALQLAPSKALWPLFEAIVNSQQAIDERIETGALQREDGRIVVTLEREGSLFADSRDVSDSALPAIIGFTVEDNGVGFTDEHLASFETTYSTLKLKLGGKGIGRLTWLKAFTEAEVESTYCGDGGWWHRKFRFCVSRDGIEDKRIASVSVEGNHVPEHRTVIRLRDARRPYRESIPKRASTIGQRIVEHCLVDFMLDRMPNTILVDGSETVDLSLVFTEMLTGKGADARDFAIGEHTLRLRHVLLRATAETKSAIHFCAHGRSVEEIPVRDLIDHMKDAIDMDGEQVRYAACVTGALLDDAVNAQRTAFGLDGRGAVPLHNQFSVSWEDVRDGAAATARDFLAPYLEEERARAFAQVQDCIKQRPQYRPLLKHKRAELERIPADVPDERLDGILHRLRNAWNEETRERTSKSIAEIERGELPLPELRAKISAAIGDTSENAQADLAQYVKGRFVILELFKAALAQMESGKFRDEEVLHEIFFPMRQESSDVPEHRHNLWLIDERLAYHDYLASDMRFVDQHRSPIVVESEDRPDVIAYRAFGSFDTPHALHPSRSKASISIVEFKKPERTNYPEDDNPVDQVLGYIERIREGKARGPDGATIDDVDPTVPFFCHVIATLTPRLRRRLQRGGFVRGPCDGTYRFLHPAYNAVLEVTGYRELLDHAQQRNRAFIDKLQIGM